MTGKDISGIIVPLLTPMNSDECINESALRGEIERMMDAGVHGIFCLGTNGEAFALNPDEKRRVIDICVKQVAGKIPVYAGTGCVTTRETVELSTFAQSAGADALSVITPYFATASQEQLFNHYRELTQAVGLPVIVYNIPARTGVSVSPELWEKLSRLPGIAGLKDSSGTFDNMLQYIERGRGTGCAVLAGNDSLILWNLLAGGQGGIAGCANVYPHTVAGIFNAFHAGDLERARRLQDSLRPLRNVFRYGNPNTIVKLAASLLGNPVGSCRKPFDTLSDEGVQALKRVLEDHPDLPSGSKGGNGL